MSTNPLDGDPNDHNDEPDDDDDEQDGAGGDDEGDDGDEDQEGTGGDDDDDDDDDGSGVETVGEEEPETDTGLATYLRTLKLGAPFAISGDFAIVEAKIVVRHEDGPHAGKMFRFDLLNAKVKHSPYDNSPLTHALIVAPPDDEEIVHDVVVHILEANGQESP